MTIMEPHRSVSHSVHINAPPERVWEVFARLERWPQWNPVCLGARHVSGRLWDVGAKFDLSLKPWWKRFDLRPTVVKSNPPQEVVWLGHKGGVYGQHTFRFEPENGGAKATSYEVFSGPMLWTLSLFSPTGRTKKMFARWLEALKAEAEKPG